MLEPKRENRIGNAGELEAELERVASQLGSATTRDVAAVVQEHLGRRVAARRETIDTALRAADGRQRLAQVFNAAIEQARLGEESSSEASPALPAFDFGQGETPRVIPSLSLLAALEPSLITLTDRGSRAPSTPATRAPHRSRTSSVLVPVPVPASTSAPAPGNQLAPRRTHPLYSAALALSLSLLVGALAPWLTRLEPVPLSASAAHTPAARSAAALVTVPVTPSAISNALGAALPAPTVQASDLPLAGSAKASPPAPTNTTRKARRAPPAPQPKRDVWTAFWERR